jgi:hypothetical protein
MRVVRALLTVAALVAGGRHPALAGDGTCAAILPPQVRVLDCRLAAAVAVGLEQSPTLRRAFARIAELQGVVYVVTAKYVAVTRKDLRGALSHQVAVSGPVCVLRITMIPDVGDRALGTFAHELRHAIEVLEHPEARSESAITALFERLGVPSGYGAYETEAAVATQMTVLRELEEWRRRPR